MMTTRTLIHASIALSVAMASAACGSESEGKRESSFFDPGGPAPSDVDKKTTDEGPKPTEERKGDGDARTGGIDHMDPRFVCRRIDVDLTKDIQTLELVDDKDVKLCNVRTDGRAVTRWESDLGISLLVIGNCGELSKEAWREPRTSGSVDWGILARDALACERWLKFCFVPPPPPPPDDGKAW